MKAEYIVLVVVVVVVVVVVMVMVVVVVVLVVVLVVVVLLVLVVVVHLAVIAGLWCFFLYNFQVLFIRGGFDKLRRQFDLWRSWSFWKSHGKRASKTTPKI